MSGERRCEQVAEGVVVGDGLDGHRPGGSRPPSCARTLGRRVLASRERGGRTRRGRIPGRRWRVITADRLSPDAQRARKAKGSTTPIGVALPLQASAGGTLCAGLPVRQLTTPVWVNGQFDLVTSRQDLVDSEWNTAIRRLVAAEWATAMVDLFAIDPPLAWAIVPTAGTVRDESSGGEGSDELDDLLIESARSVVAPNAVIAVNGVGLCHLTEVAVEAIELEGVIDAHQIAELGSARAALPPVARDNLGRWRTVLDDWRASATGILDEVAVSTSLDLFDGDTMSTDVAIKLTVAGTEVDLKGDERRGLTARCRREGQVHSVSLASRPAPWIGDQHI
jgi:hypothetical protein